MIFSHFDVSRSVSLPRWHVQEPSISSIHPPFALPMFDPGANPQRTLRPCPSPYKPLQLGSGGNNYQYTSDDWSHSPFPANLTYGPQSPADFSSSSQPTGFFSGQESQFPASCSARRGLPLRPSLVFNTSAINEHLELTRCAPQFKSMSPGVGWHQFAGGFLEPARSAVTWKPAQDLECELRQASAYATRRPYFARSVTREFFGGGACDGGRWQGGGQDAVAERAPE